MLCKKPQLIKDKGYAWIVLLLTSLSQFVHLGFSFGVVGNMTIVHQRVFSIDLRYSSVIGSVHIGTLMLFGKHLQSSFLLYMHLYIFNGSISKLERFYRWKSNML